MDSQPSSYDSLTRLHNRRSFFKTLKRETERAQLDLKPLTLVMIDIDTLKAVNDRDGHQAGDEVLRRIAGLVQDSADPVFRYAGDEFAVVLFADVDAGYRIAEEIRKHVESTTIEVSDTRDVRVTVSIGVAQLEPGTDVDQLLSRVDQAAWQARMRGGNRAEVYGRPPDDGPAVWQPVGR
jgi:diguanylate cyclase (GGDEF)-like protein